MSKIKPQIKKNNPSKSNYSSGWHIFGAVCMIGEMVLTLLGGAKKIRKNNHEWFKNLIL
ncbi:hypothetical protein [Helicobacter pylori]|uniref:hypothetical protein n=1 Tax=Helicobacter pylori TaxID=210 RepID=UPI00038CCEB3|nr:hypothetical protein [Helicobacter pylori]EQD99013.1 hypothetical protein L930_09275 [Helicobacter pylori PZ5004]QTP04186.1 hypothetical protein J5D22_07510 [Helicobacter pylori]WQU37710.1 hypothetical protein KVC64_07530 [Helicobacter pylori]